MADVIPYNTTWQGLQYVPKLESRKAHIWRRGDPRGKLWLRLQSNGYISWEVWSPITRCKTRAEGTALRRYAVEGTHRDLVHMVLTRNHWTTLLIGSAAYSFQDTLHHTSHCSHLRKPFTESDRSLRWLVTCHKHCVMSQYCTLVGHLTKAWYCILRKRLMWCTKPVLTLYFKELHILQ